MPSVSLVRFNPLSVQLAIGSTLKMRGLIVVILFQARLGEILIDNIGSFLGMTSIKTNPQTIK